MSGSRSCDAIVGERRIPSLVTESVDEAGAFLDDALASGHEGVMVKALDSTYDAGRRGGAWRKVKPVRRSTSSCSRRSGATAGARVGCRTCTSAHAAPTART